MGRVGGLKGAAIAFAAICLSAPAATAYDTVAKTVNYHNGPVFTPVYGNTSPPIGYVDYCARHSEECRVLGNASVTSVILTAQRWQQLIDVNAYVNAKIAPVSDLEQYAAPEHWTMPEHAGDCEDYVLLKKRYLEGLGFAPETMLITVVLDETGLGHAVLTVKTDAGDFILDNRRDEVRRWSETRYQFLKRQSQANPNVWVSLTTKQSRRGQFVSGGN